MFRLIGTGSVVNLIGEGSRTTTQTNRNQTNQKKSHQTKTRTMMKDHRGIRTEKNMKPVLTEEHKCKIRELRKQGKSYSFIQKEMGVSNGPVRNFCIKEGIAVTPHPNVVAANRRTGKAKVKPRKTYMCKCCGKEYKRNRNRHGTGEGKKYCSRKCAINHFYQNYSEEKECVLCGKSYATSSVGQIYCNICRNKVIIH